MPKFKVTQPPISAFASVQWSSRQGIPADPVPWKNDASIEVDSFAWIEAGTPKSNTLFNGSGQPSEPYWQLPVLRVARTTTVGASVGFYQGDFVVAVPNWGSVAQSQLRFFGLESKASDGSGRDSGYLFIKVIPLEQVSTQPTGTTTADGTPIQPTGGTGYYDPNIYGQYGGYRQPPVIVAAPPAALDTNFLLGITQLSQQSAAEREERAARAEAAADRLELADRRDRREYSLRRQEMQREAALERQKLSRYPSKGKPMDDDEDEDELDEDDYEEDQDDTGLL